MQDREPRLPRRLEFQPDRRLHLRHLRAHELRVPVALGVVLDQDVVRFLAAVLGDEPSWALREEEHEADLDQRWRQLQQRWDSPAPVAGNAVGSEGDPCRGNLTYTRRDLEVSLGIVANCGKRTRCRPSRRQTLGYIRNLPMKYETLKRDVKTARSLG